MKIFFRTLYALSCMYHVMSTTIPSEASRSMRQRADGRLSYDEQRHIPPFYLRFRSAIFLRPRRANVGANAGRRQQQQETYFFVRPIDPTVNEPYRVVLCLPGTSHPWRDRYMADSVLSWLSLAIYWRERQRWELPSIGLLSPLDIDLRLVVTGRERSLFYLERAFY